MPRYYVNPRAQIGSGDHEVHKEGCYWLGLILHPVFLGFFESCGPAKAEAKKRYSTADGCKHCSPACHTR